MAQIVFLDTDIILDYLENRNKKVRDLIAQLLFLNKKGRIVLATSIFNVVKLIDKEFEIHFLGWCLKEKMSPDEAYNKVRREEKLFREISERNRRGIEENINDFIFNEGIRVLTLSEPEEYKEILNLIYQRNLKSQDALIIATALLNKVTYFLSNDSNLIGKISDIFDTYNLRDRDLREAFRNNVLEAL
jgi:predicted nucleic acid-binding protein